MRVKSLLSSVCHSFSADSPPIYDPSLAPVPADPDSGRSNNQGFEGLTVSGDGKNLYVLLQSAMVQDGGLAKTTNRYSRMLKYDIRGTTPRLAREYIVPLPQFIDVRIPPPLLLGVNRTNRAPPNI